MIQIAKSPLRFIEDTQPADPCPLDQNATTKQSEQCDNKVNNAFKSEHQRRDEIKDEIANI